MLAHAFSHDSDAYHVSFTRMDGQWFATISRPDARAEPRPARLRRRGPRPVFGQRHAGRLYRAGGMAGEDRRLARCGRRRRTAAGNGPAPIDREKAAPCIERPAQERIGRELQALYADLLDEPVPDTLLALLGTGTPPAAAQLSV